MIFDLILALIFLSSVFFGWRKGLIKTILNLFGTLISMSLAYLLYSNVAGGIAKTSIGRSITEFANKVVDGLDLAKFVSALPVPKVLTGMITAGAEEALPPVLAKFFVSGISMLIIFVIFMIILRVAAFILVTIFKLPILNIFNKLGGLLVGALSGWIWCYLFILLCTFIIPFIPGLQVIMRGSALLGVFSKKPLNL